MAGMSDDPTRFVGIDSDEADRLRAIRTAALALSRAVDAADLPPAGRMALLALRVALGPESVVVEEEG
jgi:hypothetical protein